MSDLEDRLGRALERGAEDGPDADGLARRARTRARVRRRRTTGAVVVAAVLAVVAVSVPVALLRGGDEPAPVAGADGGWQTVRLTYETWSSDAETREVLVDVPTEWVALDPDCLRDLGVSADSCDEGEGVGLRADTGNVDYRFGPGLRPAADYGYPVEEDWLGYVEVDDSGAYVDVASDDRQTALRVLASARTPGEEIPDLAGDWPVVVGEDGVSHQAPDDPAVRVRSSPQHGARGAFGLVGYAGQQPDGTWAAAAEVGDQVVRTTAPTQALAEVVAGSARVLADDEPVEAWTTRTVSGVTLEVPPGWTRLGPCRDRLDAGTRYGPDGTDPCVTPAPLAVLGTRAVLLDGLPGLGAGFVLTGDQMVSVATDDSALTRRVLASARVGGEDPGDLSPPWEDRESEGVTWSEPPVSGVDVRVLPGYPDCAAPRTAASRLEDGRWRAGHCADRIVTVTAPTQALADLVASTVDSDLPDEPESESGSDDGWRTVTAEGVVLDVPADWVPLDTGRCRSGQTRYGPPGTDPCATPAPLAVFGSELYDNVSGPGLEAGYVLTGNQVVSVDGDDLDVVRRVLASAHVEGEDPGDLSRPWEDRESRGVTWSQPPASGVEVVVRDGFIDSISPLLAVRREDGRWIARSTSGRTVDVTAPTQALADLVASTIED